MNRKLDVTFTYTYKKGEQKEFEYSLDGYEELDTIKEAIVEKLKEENMKSNNKITRFYPKPKDIEITDVTCLEDVDSNYLRVVEENNSDSNIFDYAAVYCRFDQDAEVINAALKLGIENRDLDNSYQGHWDSKEDFARETARDTRELPPNVAGWIVIDWDATADNLMADYSEENGHYFRD